MKCHSILKKVGIVGLVFAFCIVLNGMADAQEKYPGREVTVVFGYGPGSGGDLMIRALSSSVSKQLGQPFIVNNKPGSASALALSWMKAQKPDGYNLLTVLSGSLYNQNVRKVPYDYREDFTFIMQFTGIQQGILVRADSQWKTLKELIDYAKANPGKIRMGLNDLGGEHHIALERLAMMTGAKWNYIPFGSAPPVITNLLGGHVEAGSMSATFVPNVDAGQLRLLAVMGGAETRMARYPNVPHLRDLGYDITCPTFLGLAAPKGLPGNIVDILHRAFKKAMDDQEFINMVHKFDYPIAYRGPVEFTKYLMETNESIANVVNKLGLKKE